MVNISLTRLGLFLMHFSRVANPIFGRTTVPHGLFRLSAGPRRILRLAWTPVTSGGAERAKPPVPGFPG